MMTDISVNQLRINSVNGNYVHLVPSGVVNITEKKSSGASVIAFITDRMGLRLLPVNDNMPLLWYGHDKCADGCIVLKSEAGLHAHLIELKSKLNAGKWTTAVQQFEGMLANTIAVLAFLELPAPVSVTCHIAYTQDTMRSSVDANPIFNRRLVGVPLSAASGGASPTDQFRSGSINLHGYLSVPISKVQRDESGNGQIEI
jgi:hypothetical protein